MTNDTNHYDRSAPFPVEWDAWRRAWNAWLDRQLSIGTFTHSSYTFPPQNFLADEVLGVWSVNDRPTELSEVTFPDLSGGRSGMRRPEMLRYVGITFGQASGHENGGLASTFAELERALGIFDQQEDPA